MLFSDIIAHKTIKEKLIRSVRANKIAHAQLFYGPEGSAALPLALAYAMFLNCEQPKEDGGCGTCPSCQKNIRGIHPDVHYVLPVSSTTTVKSKDAVSNSFLPEWRKFIQANPYGNVVDWSRAFGGESKQVNISREESRNIVKSVSLKAFEGKFKVILIWLPEYMHMTAANAILKVLEEPPEKTVFLLVTNDVDRLLTTIISRVQMLTIPSFTDEEVKAYLLQQGVNDAKALELAHMADGNMHYALKQKDNVVDDTHEVFREWMLRCYRKDFTGLVRQADEFQKASKAEQKILLSYAVKILRETLMAGLKMDGLIRVDSERKEFLVKLSQIFTGDKIEKIFKALDESIHHLERNANQKILFLDTSLQIMRIIYTN